MARQLFTSESVSMGHPDKVADQVSDAILDALLAQDPQSRVACETMVTTGMAVIAGEITTTARIDYQQIVRDTLKRIGYTSDAYGINGDTCAVLVSLDRQSPDISQGVTAGEGLHEEQGAGDQGLMFGYACDETEELMPFPVHYSHRLVERLAEARQSGQLAWLRPDSKSQVTVEYDEDGKVARVHTVVISTQHDPEVNGKSSDEEVLAEIRNEILEKVIKPVFPANLLDDDTIYHVNPTGKFVIGGPHGDCGLTGRKIIVDTYGGMGRHGGGAFSGKDPSKVDRSAAYAARWGRRRWPGHALRSSALLRHRRRAPALGARRDLRHRQALRRRPQRNRRQRLRPAPGRDHQEPGPAQAALRANCLPRALRSLGLPLGEDQQGR